MTFVTFCYKQICNIFASMWHNCLLYSALILEGQNFYFQMEIFQYPNSTDF